MSSLVVIFLRTNDAICSQLSKLSLHMMQKYQLLCSITHKIVSLKFHFVSQLLSFILILNKTDISLQVLSGEQELSELAQASGFMYNEFSQPT